MTLSPLATKLNGVEILMRLAGGIKHVEARTGICYRTLYRFMRAAHKEAPMEVIKVLAPLFKRTERQLKDEWHKAKRRQKP